MKMRRRAIYEDGEEKDDRKGIEGDMSAERG